MAFKRSAVRSRLSPPKQDHKANALWSWFVPQSLLVMVNSFLYAFHPCEVCPTSAAIVPTFSFTSPNIVDRLPFMAPMRISFIHSLIASSMPWMAVKSQINRRQHLLKVGALHVQAGVPVCPERWPCGSYLPKSGWGHTFPTAGHRCGHGRCPGGAVSPGGTGWW